MLKKPEKLGVTQDFAKVFESRRQGNDIMI